jgi:tetraacyldisaccharide 4'-kinase
MNVPWPLTRFLWPLSLLYGGAAKLRAWLYKRGWLKQKRLNRPVISVGNLTVGGTGKTPMVIWLAERLLAEGKRVAILSRGYRGSGGSSDEIELMKQKLKDRVLFGVGSDRYAQGRRLESAGVDVYVLDDGFQHLQLARDVDIVLVDSTRPLQRELVLPAGPLREQRSALNRAHIVIFTRAEQSKLPVNTMPKLPPFAVYLANSNLLGFRRFRASDQQKTLRQSLAGVYFAFCGIGNPEAFFVDLERWGVRVAGRRTFRDHHHYTPSEMDNLQRAAQRAGATGLVTTEKDAQNMDESMVLNMPVEMALFAIEIPEEQEFLRNLYNRLPVTVGAVAS